MSFATHPRRCEGDDRQGEGQKEEEGQEEIQEKGKEERLAWWYLCGAVGHVFNAATSIRGSSSRSSSSSSDDDCSMEDFADASALFGLNKKDLVRTLDSAVLLDPEPRHMAVVVSGVTTHTLANDIFEMGGELDPRLKFRGGRIKTNAVFPAASS